MGSNLIIAIVSGGMDSVTMAYMLATRGHPLHLLSFDYGQQHSKELEYAAKCAAALSAQHDVIDLSGLKPLLKGSALTDDSIAVPEGHYADESMSATVVPNRNAMMLSIAYAVAVAENAGGVAIGVHAGDHPIYPDCRPRFVAAFDVMEAFATEGHGSADLKLITPFINLYKQDIVEAGEGLGVQWADTWSCYQGGDVHCGKCGTCVERREAFEIAMVEDPTEYIIRK